MAECVTSKFISCLPCGAPLPNSKLQTQNYKEMFLPSLKTIVELLKMKTSYVSKEKFVYRFSLKDIRFFTSAPKFQ